MSAEGDPHGVTEIVLVGGGDPSLRRAPGGGDPSLRVLARRTVAALKAHDVSRVHLRWDASLFAPPTASSAWPAEYVASGVVAPVTALSIGDARVPDPGRAAADAFGAELAAAGIDLRGTPSSTVADTDSAELAQVESRPVADLLERMLTTSNNDYAEAFGHLVAAAAGEPATFESAAAATIEAVRGLDIPTAGVVLDDASGLARSDRVPPATLATLLATAAAQTHPELSAVQTGLPVAAFNGTLVATVHRPARVVRCRRRPREDRDADRGHRTRGHGAGPRGPGPGIRVPRRPDPGGLGPVGAGDPRRGRRSRSLPAAVVDLMALGWLGRPLPVRTV